MPTKRTVLLCVVLLVFVPACTTTSHNTATIVYNNGGKVHMFHAQAAKYRAAGTLVRFAGACMSACTVFLGLPAKQLCVTPRASFSFHKPYGSTDAGNRYAEYRMLQAYPAWVRSWLARNGGLTAQFKTMPYVYAGQFIKTCR